MSLLDEILDPFRQQLGWSRDSNKNNNLKEALESHPFSAAVKELDDRARKKDELLAKTQGYRPLVGRKTTNTPKYIGYYLLRFITWLLGVGHWFARGPIGLVGDFLEGIEKQFTFRPLKLVFYLLKQPFRWATTAISSAFQIADSILCLVYAASSGLISLMLRDKAMKNMAENVAKEFFSKSIHTLKVAVPRLILTGLIGAAAYFLGPLGMAAFTGTMGTAGAVCAVAAIGTVGITAIQAAALKLTDRCLPPPPGGGSTHRAMSHLGVRRENSRNDSKAEKLEIEAKAGDEVEAVQVEKTEIEAKAGHESEDDEVIVLAKNGKLTEAGRKRGFVLPPKSENLPTTPTKK